MCGTDRRGKEASHAALREAQRQRIAAYCTMKGLDLAEEFEDAGISAGKPLASRLIDPMPVSDHHAGRARNISPVGSA